MKKIISALLSLTMILALVAAMGISVSAADGDVLYKVNFKGDDKYSFNLFATNGSADNTYLETAEDGSSATISIFESGKRYFFGDVIDGLKIAEGNKYTVELLVDNTIPGYEAMQNFGMYINGVSDIVDEKNYTEILEGNSKYLDTFNALRGYYGTPEGWKGTPKNTLSRGAGSKTVGLYASDATNYVGECYTPDENGFCKVSIEVDGFTYRVFINGQFFDESNIPFANNYTDLALIIYVYNGGSVMIKDAVVYEGNLYTAAGFTYPALREGAVAEDWSDAMILNAKQLTMDAYEKAAVGSKLVDVIFSNGIDYAPKMLYLVGSEPVITVSGGGTQIDFDKPTNESLKDAGQGATWWGGAIGSLKYTADTAYTFTYKVKSNELRGGIFFNIDETNMKYNFAQLYNFYGNFNGTDATDMVIAASGTKIKGDATVKTTSYTKFVDLDKVIGFDADGYADMAVSIDGYDWSVYYKDISGKWVLFEMYKGTAAEFAGAPYVACGTYIYHDMATFGMKDVALYKGTLSDVTGEEFPVITEPVTTEPETTEEVTTKAPEVTDDPTDAPEVTDAPTQAPEPEQTPAPGTQAPAEENGCGGMIAGCVAIVTILGTALIVKKRD